jgi:hypothetical protein
VEGVGEAMPPQELSFLVVLAGKAGKNHQKRIILGGPGYPLGAPPNRPLDRRPRKLCNEDTQKKSLFRGSLQILYWYSSGE